VNQTYLQHGVKPVEVGTSPKICLPLVININWRHKHFTCLGDWKLSVS